MEGMRNNQTRLLDRDISELDEARGLHAEEERRIRESEHFPPELRDALMRPIWDAPSSLTISEQAHAKALHRDLWYSRNPRAANIAELESRVRDSQEQIRALDIAIEAERARQRAEATAAMHTFRRLDAARCYYCGLPGDTITFGGCHSVSTGAVLGNIPVRGLNIYFPYTNSRSKATYFLIQTDPHPYCVGQYIFQNMHGDRDLYIMAALLGLYDGTDPGRGSIDPYRGMTVNQVFEAAGLNIDDLDFNRPSGGRYDELIVRTPHPENGAQPQGQIPLKYHPDLIGRYANELLRTDFNLRVPPAKMFAGNGYIEMGANFTLSMGQCTLGEFKFNIEDKEEGLIGKFEEFTASFGGLNFSVDRDFNLGAASRVGNASFAVRSDGRGSVQINGEHVGLSVEVLHTPWMSYIKAETFNRTGEVQLARDFISYINGQTFDAKIQATFYIKIVIFHKFKRTQRVHARSHVPQSLQDWIYVTGEFQPRPFPWSPSPQQQYVAEFTRVLNRQVVDIRALIDVAAAVVVVVLAIVLIVKTGGAAAAPAAAPTTTAASGLGRVAWAAVTQFFFALSPRFTQKDSNIELRHPEKETEE